MPYSYHWEEVRLISEDMIKARLASDECLVPNNVGFEAPILPRQSGSSKVYIIMHLKSSITSDMNWSDQETTQISLRKASD